MKQEERLKIKLKILRKQWKEERNEVKKKVLELQGRALKKALEIMQENSQVTEKPKKTLYELAKKEFKGYIEKESV